MKPPTLVSNFAALKAHDEQLLRVGMMAERYFPEDPNTAVLKLRQLGELLAQMVASQVGLFSGSSESQYDLLLRLRNHGILPREIYELFGEIRRAGNAASHGLEGDHRGALATLKIAWQAVVWFHRTFKDPNYKSGPFIPPKPPADETQELKAELAQLSSALVEHQAASQETSELLEITSAELQSAQSEKEFWEQMALENDAANAALQKRLAEQQIAGAAQPKTIVTQMVAASKKAADHLKLDEAETRKLIDEQLRKAGWQADTLGLRYAKGTRPEKGKNLAIAEWPTAHGPADYVLFLGLIPIAAVEAKRKNRDVSASLQQAQRYSRGFEAHGDIELHSRNWGKSNEFRIPFVFSSNGRPYLQQIATLSGIWFRDLRQTDNLGTALQGWYSPEGLAELLKQDVQAAHDQLALEKFEYGFLIRDYQKAAILCVEKEIEKGTRNLLLAMATGTGKTKTCIALIYRLLKTKRFRRILFLVDRSALGEQAAGAFKETRMESLQTFADIFGIKELTETTPETATAVHIATVQGMVSRVLNPAEANPPPTVDQYDCVIVDECHRGYLLDRELSETELTFRNFEDYVSQYRRVLDYFDAVKIGLTATPALHTTEIFGPPVYSYSYREAVIDGHLIDHEPPYKITTELSSQGIVWRAGEQIPIYRPGAPQMELFQTPDEVKLEIEDFNRKVITRPFNQVVCEYLARELDPTSRQKTLIFCATDAHADLVVDLLKNAFKEYYGSVEDDAVVKITGASDKPLSLLLHYKNEQLPNVAVTVDLLTTGIDVPAICNIVFLRRVNSRILFDQMLGRATRQCPAVGKETFRIFDAVRIYEALEPLTAMKPVVVNPSLSFKQLVQELTQLSSEEAQALVRDQLLAKLQRKKRHLNDEAKHDFETAVGLNPEAFIEQLKSMPLAQIAAWFTQAPGLGEILDRKTDGTAHSIYVSEHPDQFVSAEQGYGAAKKPEDYIEEFKQFIHTQGNKLPALMTVVTRPRDLTRRQLRELLWELDKAGYSEVNLASAWKQMTNQEIAARIVGYIRQAALGDPLIPYEQRVDAALQSILSSRAWTNPQRQWLQKIAAQTKSNLLVDREALDDPDLIFKRDGGGFVRLNKLFDGQLVQLLANFNDAVWKQHSA